MINLYPKKNISIDSSPLLLTIDVDWAPDWMVWDVAEILIRRRVKCTWFITHASPAVDALMDHPDLFERGIHPNCLSKSTHGKTEKDVLHHLTRLVPEAVSMRTHGLYQSTSFLVCAASSYGIQFDASMLIPKAKKTDLHIFEYNGVKLWRAPYFWEDDYEAGLNKPDWMPAQSAVHRTGLGIFDFHPVHIAMNTNNLKDYNKASAERPPNLWTRDHVKSLYSKGNGARSAFLELVDHIANEGGGYRVKDLLGLSPDNMKALAN